MNNLPFLRAAKTCSKLFYREYAFKSDLKIKWIRPEKISCVDPRKSGDLSGVAKIDTSQFILEYQKSKELENSDEITKSLFRLGNNRRVHTSNVYREMLIKEVQRHSLDYGSVESKIAEMTAKIRCFQEFLKEHPRNKVMKVQCKELIDKRKKFLKYLRRWDYKRFEWILEKLDLVYKPPPPEFHWITRKDSLRKLTDIHCENIKTKRLNEYRELLESQQIGFLEKKLEKLEFVRKEQEECQVPVTVSLDEIKEVRDKLKELHSKRNLTEKVENN